MAAAISGTSSNSLLDASKGCNDIRMVGYHITPLVVALIGSSIWMEWSENIVSWELGISMIALASLSMWLSLRANSGIIFSVVAVTSGLLPLLYEYNNEDVGNGGAISLLVFIIAVKVLLLQTTFAPRLDAVDFCITSWRSNSCNGNRKRTRV